MYLQSAEYNLTNGLFEAGQVELGLPVSASFNQYDGTVSIATLSFGQALYPGAGGNYALYLICMSVHCFFYVPTISVTNSIAFSSMTDPQKEFGPVRLWGSA